MIGCFKAINGKSVLMSGMQREENGSRNITNRTDVKPAASCVPLEEVRREIKASRTKMMNGYLSDFFPS